MNNMEKTERKLIIIIAAVTISLMVVILVGVKDSFRVSLNPGKELTLNREQQQLIENRDIIKIYVEKDLRYLDEEFLQDYLQSIAEPTRLKIRVVTDPGENIDGTLNVVTDRLREKADELQISAPLFQVKGGLFVSENIFRKKKLPKELDGAMAGDLLTEPQLDILSYNGSKIIVKKRNSAKATVALAAAEGMDCIVGNREAIMCELKAGGLQKKYLDTGAEFRTQNVCISSGKENAVFCELMSQCIQKADKRLLLLQAEERQGYRPIRLLDENRYGNMAILMAIISFAVFLTFFLYYQSNKNLYNELTERMNQLTASKKELKTTFNSVSYYMAELTPDGIISDINKAFLDFVDKECLGRHLLQVMDFYREDRKVLSSHLDAAREEKRFPRKKSFWEKAFWKSKFIPWMIPAGK